MKRLILGATTLSLMLAISGCASESDKYIGEWEDTSGINMSLMKDSKCELREGKKIYASSAQCKWNVDTKIINIGSKEKYYFSLNSSTLFVDKDKKAVESSKGEFKMSKTN